MIYFLVCVLGPYRHSPYLGYATARSSVNLTVYLTETIIPNMVIGMTGKLDPWINFVIVTTRA
ncbi:hypothetical protein N7486_003160 [Penicillium sp. IBT 16267x]|nr:hypothetical protein N7486_003160 [Penicillium sp. IBT 16267x]